MVCDVITILSRRWIADIIEFQCGFDTEEPTMNKVFFFYFSRFSRSYDGDEQVSFCTNFSGWSFYLKPACEKSGVLFL